MWTKYNKIFSTWDLGLLNLNGSEVTNMLMNMLVTMLTFFRIMTKLWHYYFWSKPRLHLNPPPYIWGLETACFDRTDCALGRSNGRGIGKKKRKVQRSDWSVLRQRLESLRVHFGGWMQGLCWPLSLQTVHCAGVERRAAIRLATEKASIWLWIKRGDLWPSAAGTQVGAWSPPSGSPGRECMMFKDPKHPMNTQEHHWWCVPVHV